MILACLYICLLFIFISWPQSELHQHLVSLWWGCENTSIHYLHVFLHASLFLCTRHSPRASVPSDGGDGQKRGLGDPIFGFRNWLSEIQKHLSKQEHYPKKYLFSKSIWKVELIKYWFITEAYSSTIYSISFYYGLQLITWMWIIKHTHTYSTSIDINIYICINKKGILMEKCSVYINVQWCLPVHF